MSCEKSQWSAQNRLVLSSSSCSQAGAAGRLCQAVGLLLQHLPSSALLLWTLQHGAHAATQLWWGCRFDVPLQTLMPCYSVPETSQDQSCIFFPCILGEDCAKGAVEGFLPLSTEGSRLLCLGYCHSHSFTPELLSVQEPCIHNHY